MKTTRFAAVYLAIGGLLAASTAAAGDPPKLPADIKLTANIPYVEKGHERNKLDIYLPANATGKLPVVLCIHGGGWKAGDKEWAADFLPLVRHGYALAGCNYRYSSQAKFPAQIEDCKAAVRWLRANAQKYHFDPDHIGVMGNSAGGHLVALLGTTADERKFDGAGGNAEQSSRVQAVVDIFGPTDFSKMSGQSKPVVAELLGGAPDEHKDLADAASPITYVSAKSAPFLILHGTKDELVPISQSETFAEALKKAGVEVTFTRIDGAGHGGPQFSTPERMQEIEKFLDKHLKPAAETK